MRYVLKMEVVFDINEEIIDKYEDFNEGVLNGGVTVGDLEMNIIDPDGDETKVDTIDDAEMKAMLIESFMKGAAEAD